MPCRRASSTPSWREALAYERRAPEERSLRCRRTRCQRVQTATTIRTGNGKLSTTDGPFAETKEQLGGFVLIEARDLNDAIQVAAKIPPGRLGSIEVRPIQELVAP